MYEPKVDRTFTVDKLAAKIAAQEPFAFSRWGDGEWRAVVAPNARKSNCDGHAYFPDMSVALGNALRSRPNYILGFQHWPKKVRKPWCEWLEREGLTDLEWVEANIFHWCAQKGDWRFREWPDILVGPMHLEPVFPNATCIYVPDKNCWRATEPVLAALRHELRVRDQHTVVGFCASMAANAWIHTMHHEYPQHTLIDFGSVFDPLAGVYSRRYMRRAAKEAANG